MNILSQNDSAQEARRISTFFQHCFNGFQVPKVANNNSAANARFGAIAVAGETFPIGSLVPKGASQANILRVRFYHRDGYTPTMFTCHITMQMQSDAAKAAPLI
jgi:hypothetical protein